MRAVLTTTLELVGLAVIVAGVALISWPVALIVGGGFAVGVGYLERR